MLHGPSHTSRSALHFQMPDSAPHPRHQISQRHPLDMSMTPHDSDPGGTNPVACELKSVSFPRDCLNRFASISSINTARNQETCGLLLGKYKGGRYVVTTLLIPKQHHDATGDTFVIDEEELVMQFTEKRCLIILGWVYRLCWWILALCS